MRQRKRRWKNRGLPSRIGDRWKRPHLPQNFWETPLLWWKSNRKLWPHLVRLRASPSQNSTPQDKRETKHIVDHLLAVWDRPTTKLCRKETLISRILFRVGTVRNNKWSVESARREPIRISLPRGALETKGWTHLIANWVREIHSEAEWTIFLTSPKLRIQLIILRISFDIFWKDDENYNKIRFIQFKI